MEPKNPIQTIDSRREDRQKINNDVEMFLASGGKIKEVDSSHNQSAISKIKNCKTFTDKRKKELISRIENKG